jgi:nucleotide-binding universal stress UspA family protein
MTTDAPILFAYDGSDSARGCVSEIAELFGSRPVVVLTVWESGLAYAAAMPVSGMELAPAPVTDVEAAREADHELKAGAERIARDGAELARSAGLRAEAVAVRDETRVAEAIGDQAREIGAAAIVVGSRGLSGLRARMEGSTSSAVLKHAPCPVLVIHHD